MDNNLQRGSKCSVRKTTFCKKDKKCSRDNNRSNSDTSNIKRKELPEKNASPHLEFPLKTSKKIKIKIMSRLPSF